MDRVVTIVAAALWLYSGIFTLPAGAAPFAATVQAKSNLNGNFPAPNPRNVDSGVLPGDSTAQAGDSINYTAPGDFYTISGKNMALVGMATFKINQELTSNGPAGIGMAGVITANFSDQVIVGFDNKSPQAGKLQMHLLVDGIVMGGTGTYAGTLMVDITVLNSGSAPAPKNLTYHIHQENRWGEDGDGVTTSGPDSITLSSGDVLTLTGVEMLTEHVGGKGEFSKVNADFGHTTHFYLDSTTPGYKLTAVSGHDYATPKEAAVKNAAWTLYE